VLTLTALAGLAFWGHAHNWQLTLTPPGGSDPPSKDGDSAVVKVLNSSRIEFPSLQAVKKAGIRDEPAKLQDLSHYVVANGMVDYEPALYARLTSRAAGIVWRVYKEIGSPIQRGEVLALLDAAEVGKIKADFLQSLTQFRLRSSALSRLKEADKQGAVSLRSLQEAEASVREARIKLFNDQQALLNLGLSIRIEEVENLDEKELVRHLRLLGLPEAIQRQLPTETITANLLPLTAPFDGLVVDRNAATGEVVQTTQPKTLFVVADVRHLHIDIDVNPEDMAWVHLGQPVEFRTDGSNIEAACKVTHISPEVDEKTRRVKVHAETQNPDGRLRPNAFGTGRILVTQRAGVVVPAEAVQADASGDIVFVCVSDTVFEARRVNPGLRQSNVVEVDGVRAGERVVTHGSYILKSELQKDRIAGGED
jgi:cobalt-zinc-cadmium efflux system membrane fusion protein